MIRTYLFACHEHIEKLHTFSVSVAQPHAVADEEECRKAALAAAKQTAESKGLSEPRLVTENGVAEIQVILDKGEVTAVYCRNSKETPFVTIVDLDYSEDPQQMYQKIIQQLERKGYVCIPHSPEE